MESAPLPRTELPDATFGGARATGDRSRCVRFARVVVTGFVDAMGACSANIRGWLSW